MFSLPVKRYHVDEFKVNHSLQALYETIVSDLNKLANEGLPDAKLGDPCFDLYNRWVLNVGRALASDIGTVVVVYLHSWQRTKTIYFSVVAIKGDLKFLKQAFNLVRHAGSEEAKYGCYIYVKAI